MTQLPDDRCMVIRHSQGHAATTRTRVAIVLPTHWAVAMGGAEYQCKLLCEHLSADARFEVHWLSVRVPEGTQPTDYRIHRFGRRRKIGARAYFLDSVSLQRKLDEIRPDVIYQRGGSGLTLACAVWARRRGATMVWNGASDDDFGWPPVSLKALRKPLSWVDRWLSCRGVRIATHLIAQHEGQRQWLSERFGRADARVISNFHPWPNETLLKDPGFTVLWIANFKPLKRPDLFIALARELESTGARFIMIGHPSTDADWMRLLLSDVEQVPNLQYLGPLQQSAVNEALSRSHLLVNTSESEGFPNTFIQAWMRKVPVITFKVDPGGLLRDPDFGCCAAGDWARFVDDVRLVFNDPSRRDQIGERVREYALEHFGPANITKLTALIAPAVTAPDMAQDAGHARS